MVRCYSTRCPRCGCSANVSGLAPTLDCSRCHNCDACLSCASSSCMAVVLHVVSATVRRLVRAYSGNLRGQGGLGLLRGWHVVPTISQSLDRYLRREFRSEDARHTSISCGRLGCL